MTLYLTYDTEINKDGFGAQYHRIVGIFCLARLINAKYLHTPITLFEHLDNSYCEKINEHFGLNVFENNIDRPLFFDEIITNTTPKSLESLNINTENKNILIKICYPHNILDKIPDKYNNVMDELRQLKKKYNLKEFEKDKINIGIHIRRGDVDLINNSERYINNDHYIKIINILNKKYNNCNICIFSQGSNNFEEFKKIKNVKLLSDLDILETFEYLCNSDYLIMAKSSLSYLAGLYNTNENIFIESSFWHSKLNHWKYTKELFTTNLVEGFENYTIYNSKLYMIIFFVVFLCVSFFFLYYFFFKKI